MPRFIHFCLYFSYSYSSTCYSCVLRSYLDQSSFHRLWLQECCHERSESRRWRSLVLYIFLIVFSFLMTACAHISCCVRCLFKIQKAIDCILFAVWLWPAKNSTEPQNILGYLTCIYCCLFGIPFSLSRESLLAQKCVNAFTVRIASIRRSI